MGRSPHGERGLKLNIKGADNELVASLPAWGAWIEIPKVCPPGKNSKSLPAWGAWIEIFLNSLIFPSSVVAPRMGSVD